MIWDSGIPTRSTAWAAATAMQRACGSAFSDVFGGEDHDSSGYEFDVFSGVEHFCKVVDCCVRV